MSSRRAIKWCHFTLNGAPLKFGAGDELPARRGESRLCAHSAACALRRVHSPDVRRATRVSARHQTQCRCAAATGQLHSHTRDSGDDTKARGKQRLPRCHLDASHPWAARTVKHSAAPTISPRERCRAESTGADKDTGDENGNKPSTETSGSNQIMCRREVQNPDGKNAAHWALMP